MAPRQRKDLATAARFARSEAEIEFLVELGQVVPCEAGREILGSVSFPSRPRSDPAILESGAAVITGPIFPMAFAWIAPCVAISVLLGRGGPTGRGEIEPTSLMPGKMARAGSGGGSRSRGRLAAGRSTGITP